MKTARHAVADYTTTLVDLYEREVGESGEPSRGSLRALGSKNVDTGAS